MQPRFSEEEIRATVRRLAREISEAYRDERPLLVGVLKGSFVFLADLVRELTIPFEVDFLHARSYGTGMTSAGRVEIVKDVETDLRGRHVVVVEDIVDTGLTMAAVLARIAASAPASVKRCALPVREGYPPPEFAGFRIGPGFVVGYGIDHAEQYRGLRDICRLE